MSKVPAHWDKVAEAVTLRNAYNPQTLILGNGDAENILDAQKKLEYSGADGIMLGRAIFGNPWLFSRHPVPHLSERLGVMVEHTKLFEELLPHKNFAIMKKHYKAYVNNFPGAAELRAELMEAPDASRIEAIVHSWLAKNGTLV
jgi:tRNA-dihydrouridine synthase